MCFGLLLYRLNSVQSVLFYLYLLQLMRLFAYIRTRKVKII